MTVSPLLTVFGFLTCRAATVSTGDILFLFGLGLYLVVLLAGTTATTKRNTVYQDVFKITLFTHNCQLSIVNYLMVEKSDTCKCHGDAILVAGHDDMVVANAATSLGYELNTTLVGTLDIVTKGEEGI